MVVPYEREADIAKSLLCERELVTAYFLNWLWLIA